MAEDSGARVWPPGLAEGLDEAALSGVLQGSFRR